MSTGYHHPCFPIPTLSCVDQLDPQSHPNYHVSALVLSGLGLEIWSCCMMDEWSMHEFRK